MKPSLSYDVFLSHNSADKTVVEELAQRIQADGLRPFLDKWHLVPGVAWQEELEESLCQSRSCAVLIGASGTGAWQNEEMRAALQKRVRDRDFRVIPVMLPGAECPERTQLPTFLSMATWVDFSQGLDDDDAYRRLIAGIRGVPPGMGPTPVGTRQLMRFIAQYKQCSLWKKAAFWGALATMIGVLAIIVHSLGGHDAVTVISHNQEGGITAQSVTTHSTTVIQESEKPLSLTKLTASQRRLLRKIWYFQKSKEIDKVLIPDEMGTVTFSGIATPATKYDFEHKVMQRLNPDELSEIHAIPRDYIRVIPDARFPGVTIVSIPDEVGALLDGEISKNARD